MTGIIDVSVYVPRYRLTGEILAPQWGGSSKGSRSVANHDEDPVTMAWEAADPCLEVIGADNIDALYLASTSLPYAEKNNAAFLATALNLKSDIFCAELAGSLRAGIGALRAARDSVAAGSAKSALVAAADMRMAQPGDPAERSLGDAAGALLVGSDNPVARIVDIKSTVKEFIDVWRTPEDKFIQKADAKFVQDEGYTVFQAQAAKAVLEANSVDISGVKAVVPYTPDVRTIRAIARSLKVDPEKCFTMINEVGDAGVASPFTGLMVALHKCGPGDYILLLSHSSGADAVLLQVTEAVEDWKARRGPDGILARATPAPSYGKFLQFRNVLPAEVVNPWTSPAVLWREEKENFRRIAKKCNNCGAIQYPPRRICWNCSTKDDMADRRLESEGTVYTFTKDHLPPNPNPPTVMVSVDVDGGGRFYTQLTDCDPENVKVGMRVRFTMRRLHFGGGFHNYFWKFRPTEVEK